MYHRNTPSALVAKNAYKFIPFSCPLFCVIEPLKILFLFGSPKSNSSAESRSCSKFVDVLRVVAENSVLASSFPAVIWACLASLFPSFAFFILSFSKSILFFVSWIFGFGLFCFMGFNDTAMRGHLRFWELATESNCKSLHQKLAPFLMLLPLFLAGEELKRSETNFERRNYIQAMAKNPGAIEEIETVNLNYLLLFLRQFCQSRLHCLTNWLHNNWPGVIILLFTHYACLLVNIKVDYIKFRHIADKTSFKSQWTMVICNAAHKEVMVNMFWQKVCSSCTPLRDSSPSQYRFITRNIF